MSIFRVRDTEHYEYPQLSIFYNMNNDEFNYDYLEKNFTNYSKNALYIHIPFCSSFCIFCNYYKEKDNNVQLIGALIDAIIKELQWYANLPFGYRIIEAIHFGGGTPSCIGSENLERIISKVKELYCLDDNCIISIEAHIRDLQSAEYVRALQAIGVNRVSFGIQSCSESLRKTYGLMPLSYVYNAVDILRAVGIYDYNSDIMYGFPEQKCDEIIADIESVFDLGVNCLDLYALNVFPGTRMERFLRKSDSYDKFINVQEKNTYKEIYRYIGENGEYNLVMSNTISKRSTLPNSYLNIHLGTNRYEGGNIIGIGPSSRGYLSGYTYKNHTNIYDYIKAISEKGVARYMEYHLSEMEKRDRTLVMFPNYTFIMKRDCKVSDTARQVLHTLLNEGIIFEDKEKYYITKRNCFWSGNISAMFYSIEQKKKMAHNAILNRRHNLNMYNQDKMQIIER